MNILEVNDLKCVLRWNTCEVKNISFYYKKR